MNQARLQSIDLKVLLLNAENLFLLSDQKLTRDHLLYDEVQWQKLSTSVFFNKSIYKCQQIARLIKEENPDIIMLCEVGGLESLNNFNTLFLDESWSPALIEGNSDRHIDVGFLIKKNLGFYFDLISNKNRSINYQYPHRLEKLDKADPQSYLKFSRDVAELHLFLTSREKPFAIFLLSHLKSHLDPEGVDPRGSERREAELKTMIDIYLELENKYSVPIVVAGDFNGNATSKNTDHEFKAIYERSQLKDVLELDSVKSELTATYYQVSRSQKTEGKQLDYALLSPHAAQCLAPGSAHVYRYKNASGFELDPPTSLEEKSLLPSDHYPLVFTLKNINVF